MLGRFGFPEFILGSLKNMPLPGESTDIESRRRLGELASSAWYQKRHLDTVSQGSHAFILPALLQVRGGNLAARAAAWSERVREVNEDLRRIHSEIDDLAFGLYDIDAADRAAIESGVSSTGGLGDGGAESDDAEAEAEDGEEEEATADVAALVTALISWAVGVAFGRFDVRVATGDRAVRSEPDLFDPLPSCSPGMLTGEDGLPVELPPVGYPIKFPSNGILADDPGDRADITGRVRAVFGCVFGTEVDSFWREAAQILGNDDGNLRPWLSRSLFEDTIRRYSKGGRKAPIYWQLATSSGRCSISLYYHCLTKETFYTVLSDHVDPKLQHEQRQLRTLLAESGDSPNSAQRRQMVEQEILVEELRAFREEIARIAPLWMPNQDDGVVINFAPLWRLVPHHRAWQSECKACWDKLVAGDYDWSHLAMHLWPERVAPKCADNLSLAFAHELEDVFWFEDADGKWKKRKVPARPVDELVRERTSPAVKAALKSLLEAPAANGGSRRGRRRTAR
jgi:hypothetical protein